MDFTRVLYDMIGKAFIYKTHKTLYIIRLQLMLIISQFLANITTSHKCTLCGVHLLLCVDSRCSLCPEGWMWWRSHCYFFSVGLQEHLRWNESAEFCRRHNSSLIVIKDYAEMVITEEVLL
uniref:C-type lectin domain-containing protein n=1 Tax=Labrus bergylta TaxID=56723 RepID=A0A3Q3H0R0_9LABR